MKQGWIQVNEDGIKEPLAPKTLANMVYLDEVENKTILDEMTTRLDEMATMLDEMTTKLAEMAPKNHANSKSTYGAASATDYGHAIAAGETNVPLKGSEDGSIGSAGSARYAIWNHRHPYNDRIRSAGDEHVFYTGADTYFRPSETAISNLGTTSRRWIQVFSVNAASVSSDEREKKDIQAIDEATKLIMGIEPVKYRRIDDSENLHYGFIAQQVKATLEKIGIKEKIIYTRDSIDEDIPEEAATEDQVTYALVYTELIAPLVAVVQQQQQQLSDLEQRLAELESSRD